MACDKTYRDLKKRYDGHRYPKPRICVNCGSKENIWCWNGDFVCKTCYDYRSEHNGEDRYVERVPLFKIEEEKESFWDKVKKFFD